MVYTGYQLSQYRFNKTKRKDVMSYLHLSNEAAGLIEARGKTDDKKEALTDKLAKIMHYTAFRASECESPDLHEEVRHAVTASFTKRERTLIAYTRAEAKSLNELQKEDRTTSTAYNASGGSYIYMAFAAAPLVGTNNVPANAR